MEVCCARPECEVHPFHASSIQYIVPPSSSLTDHVVLDQSPYEYSYLSDMTHGLSRLLVTELIPSPATPSFVIAPHVQLLLIHTYIYPIRQLELLSIL